MDELSIEEKEFLINSFRNTGKNYTEAYRAFYSKYGNKVSSKSVLRRVIDNYIEKGILYDGTDEPGPSCTVTPCNLHETINTVKAYFKENPNSSIRKAARVLGLKREIIRKIGKNMY